MKNKPLLNILEELVYLDQQLFSDNQRSILFRKRARLLEKLGCYSLAKRDNMLSALLEKEDINFSQQNIIKGDSSNLLEIKFYTEKETVYYDYLSGIVLNDCFFHQDTLDPMNFIARAGNLEKLGLLELALRDYKQGMEYLKDFPEEFAIACTDAGMALNLLGDYKNGWPLYEKRWQTNYKSFKNPLSFPFPRWQGENIENKTLLIHSEQGIGDNIQFVRYAILLKKQGVNILVWNHSDIDDFLNFNLEKYSIPTVKAGDSVNFDYWVSMMSLPYLLKTELDTIPYAKGYLRSSEKSILNWKSKIACHQSKLKIGIVWQGGKATGTDKIRSIPLNLFNSLFQCNANFYCLQKEISDNDEKILSTYNNVFYWKNELKSFFDTSAIIEQMDLVICVDTSVAHLAAAMGKETWILINYIPDFRWLLNRNDSVWYESVKLFRQNIDYDWESVMTNVVCKLNARLD